MYFLHCLPLVRLIYYENHVSAAPEKPMHFPYGKIFGLTVGTQAVTHNIQPAAFNYTISIRSLTSTGGFWQTAAQECHTRQNQDMLILTGFSLTDAWILCFKMHMAHGGMLTTATNRCAAVPPPQEKSSKGFATTAGLVLPLPRALPVTRGSSLAV